MFFWLNVGVLTGLLLPTSVRACAGGTGPLAADATITMTMQPLAIFTYSNEYITNDPNAGRVTMGAAYSAAQAAQYQKDIISEQIFEVVRDSMSFPLSLRQMTIDVQTVDLEGWISPNGQCAAVQPAGVVTSTGTAVAGAVVFNQLPSRIWIPSVQTGVLSQICTNPNTVVINNGQPVGTTGNVNTGTQPFWQAFTVTVHSPLPLFLSQWSSLAQAVQQRLTAKYQIQFNGVPLVSNGAWP